MAKILLLINTLFFILYTNLKLSDKITETQNIEIKKEILRIVLVNMEKKEL